MKRIISILVIVFSFISMYSQDYAKYIPDAQLAGVDTLKGADTIYIRTPFLKWNLEYIGLQVKCTEIGGTSDGTIYPQISLDDTSYVNITSTDYLIYSFPNDTLTIEDGLIGVWNILSLPNNYAGIMAIGTTGDTTRIELKYSIKGKR